MKKTFYVEHEGKILDTRKSTHDYRWAVIYRTQSYDWRVDSYSSRRDLAEKKAYAISKYEWVVAVDTVPVLEKK